MDFNDFLMITSIQDKCKTAYLGGGGCTGAADKLNAAEHINSTGQEHGEAAQFHGAVAAGGLRSPVPLVKVPAAGLVVDVVEQTVLGHEQSVRLEGPLKTSSVEKVRLIDCLLDALKMFNSKLLYSNLLEITHPNNLTSFW